MGACVSTNLNTFGPDEHGQATRIAHQGAEREMKEVSNPFPILPSSFPRSFPISPRQAGPEVALQHDRRLIIFGEPTDKKATYTSLKSDYSSKLSLSLALNSPTNLLQVLLLGSGDSGKSTVLKVNLHVFFHILPISHRLSP